MAEKTNGVVEEEEEENFNQEKMKTTTENLYDVVHRFISEPSHTANRIKTSLSPFIPEASRNYTRRVLLWSRQGSPLRPLLLISVTLSLTLYYISISISVQSRNSTCECSYIMLCIAFEFARLLV